MFLQECSEIDVIIQRIYVDYDWINPILLSVIDITEENKPLRDYKTLARAFPSRKAITWHFDTRNNKLYCKSPEFADILDYKQSNILHLIHEDDLRSLDKECKEILASDAQDATLRFVRI